MSTTEPYFRATWVQNVVTTALEPLPVLEATVRTALSQTATEELKARTAATGRPAA